MEDRVGLRMRPVLLTAGLLLSLSGWLCVAPARAEPYMAIREGRKCSACHVNMAGPGKRTELATTHLKEITHYRDIFPELAQASDVFNGQITRNFSVGADLRVDDSIVFQDKPDADGRVDRNEVLRGRVEENILAVRRAPIYFQLDLVPDYLLVYLDEQFAPGSPTTREVFGLLKGVLPWRGYVKGGKFFPEYGLRTENDDLFSIDNTANNVFVRGRTGTDFSGFDEGFEIGFEPGPFHVATSVTNGSPGDSDVRFTFTSYTVLRDLPVVRNLLVGASMLRVSPQDSERIAYGFFAGSNIGRFEYQAEVDFIDDHDDKRNKSIGQFLCYGEVNYLFFDWVNFKIFGEYADHDSIPDTTNDAQNRFGFGLEPFLGRFLQTRLFYSIANGVPEQPAENQSRLILEMHVFF
jgi:hypothetical protein